MRRTIGTVVRRCIETVTQGRIQLWFAGALGLWLRGLRCVIVLVGLVQVKSASRPFGLEQVRLLTCPIPTREGRSYADPR